MKLFQGFIIIGLCLAIVHPCDAQTILSIVGSSTSACSGPSVPESCYVFRLRKYYENTPPSDTVIDNGYAVPGYNVYQGMPTSYVPPRPEAMYQPDPAHNITAALNVNPRAVLVNYPTNQYDVLSVAEIMFCLRTIRDSANKKGVPCFVTTTQPRTSPAIFNTPAMKLKLAEIKDSVLLEFGSFAIDFWTGLINPVDSSIRYPDAADDGIHMGDTGHDSLFRRVVRKNVFLATLPLSFIQCNAQSQASGNLISWTTTNESGVNYFEVQKSSDRISFARIATLPGSNSGGVNNYRFVDNQPQTGIVYYRIVEVDNDGKKQMTAVMTVRAASTASGINKVFVAPGNQLVMDVFLDKSSEGEIQVLNNTGVTVARSRHNLSQGNSSVYINTPPLSAGIYYLRLRCGSEIMTRSFVKY